MCISALVRRGGNNYQHTTTINIISLIILHMEGILMTKWLLISWAETTDRKKRKGKGRYRMLIHPSINSYSTRSHCMSIYYFPEQIWLFPPRKAYVQNRIPDLNLWSWHTDPKQQQDDCEKWHRLGFKVPWRLCLLQPAAWSWQFNLT